MCDSLAIVGVHIVPWPYPNLRLLIKFQILAMSCDVYHHSISSSDKSSTICYSLLSSLPGAVTPQLQPNSFSTEDPLNEPMSHRSHKCTNLSPPNPTNAVPHTRCPFPAPLHVKWITQVWISGQSYWEQGQRSMVEAAYTGASLDIPDMIYIQ